MIKMNKIEKNLLPSNKKFGYTFSIIFSLFFLYFFIYGSFQTYIIFGFISFLFLFMAIFFSELLLPLNILWFRLGIILGKIISPIVIGLIFFFIITPIALLGRLMGRDELKLKRNKVSETYWVERKPVGPDPKTFKNQF